MMLPLGVPWFIPEAPTGRKMLWVPKPGLVDPQTKPAFPCAVDWSHPLSRGLVGCWLFNEMGGDIFTNLATKQPNSSLNIRWKGDWADFSYGTSTKIITDITPFPNTQPFTVMCLAIKGEAAVLRTVVSNIEAANYQGVHFGISGGSVLRAYVISYYGANDMIWINTSTIGDYYPHHLCCTYNGSKLVSGLKIYLDGKEDAVTASLDNLTGTEVPTSSIRIGDLIGSGESWYGQMYYLHFWKRALTPSEIQSLYLSPYQFIKPVMPYGYYYGVEEAGVTVPIMWNYYQKMRMR